MFYFLQIAFNVIKMILTKLKGAPMGVPENIDALLVKFDINQDCLARVAGVHPSAITRWRNGAQPRDKAVQKICENY